MLDFNLVTSDLKDGYYVILGTIDDATPLPDPSIRLEVRDGVLLVHGDPATKWSYVILDVQRTQTRPPEMNDGANWADKLREAEDEARLLMQDPLANDKERKQIWEKCLKLIQEAQTLLRADDNFLAKDSSNIVMTTLDRCRQLIDLTNRKRSTKETMQSDISWMPELPPVVGGMPPDEQR